MSDTPIFDPDDDVHEVEALLRELDTGDFELVAPPVDVWLGIEAELAGDTVVSLDARRSRFSTRFLAAAATIAMLAVGAVVVASFRGDSEPVIATAELSYDAEAFDPLGANASATAQLVEHDGRYEITLADASLPDPESNDLELWLIAVRDDGSLDVRPVSLVDASSPGTYVVPADLDPAIFSIVDISVEPRDGDEAHSGRSILRGSLTDV